MPGMKITLSAAMRARDVSRPRPEHEAAAELSNAAEYIRPVRLSTPGAVTCGATAGARGVIAGPASGTQGRRTLARNIPDHNRPSHTIPSHTIGARGGPEPAAAAGKAKSPGTPKTPGQNGDAGRGRSGGRGKRHRTRKRGGR